MTSVLLLAVYSFRMEISILFRGDTLLDFATIFWLLRACCGDLPPHVVKEEDYDHPVDQSLFGHPFHALSCFDTSGNTSQQWIESGPTESNTVQSNTVQSTSSRRQSGSDNLRSSRTTNGTPTPISAARCKNATIYQPVIDVLGKQLISDQIVSM